jgi:hypothetical protein
MSDKKKSKVTFDQVRQVAANDPEAFATKLLGEEPTMRSASVVRYFENQSLAVFLTGHAQGRFKSFVEEDKRGSMIDLLMWVRGISDDRAGRHEAVEQAKVLLGMAEGEFDVSKISMGPSPEEKRRQVEEENAKKIRVANWIWNSSSATEGREEGLAYLRNRAITCDFDSDTLRFRRLAPTDLQKMGLKRNEIPATPVVALVFAARDKNRNIRAVQQVLTTEGRKLKCENPKRTNGLMEGAGVWFGNPATSDKAVLVEGPETGGSIYQASGLPTCVTLGTSNFTKVHLPGNIQTVITAADMEPFGRGLASALNTAQHWKADGRQASGIALPKLNDGDFNDIHQARGEEAVRSSIENAYYPPERERDGTILATPDARAAFHAWHKTGIEVCAKIPARDKETGKFNPISLDTMVDAHHNRVLVVHNKAIQVKDEFLRKSRPELEIMDLHEDSKAFRALSKTEGAMEAAINAVDIYAPDGRGEKEPVFFSLRRSDADALKLVGHKSIALRSTAIDRVDLGFMNGREAIVAPIGNGTDHDARLTRRLDEAGAKTMRLTWQIFRADEPTPKITRREIPEGYGAAHAAQEGWTGRALKDLIDISRANHRQMEMAREQVKQPAPRKVADVAR